MAEGAGVHQRVEGVRDGCRVRLASSVVFEGYSIAMSPKRSWNADLSHTLKHYECYNEPHYERNIHYEFRGLLMPTALGALHKTSLLIHMPNA